MAIRRNSPLYLLTSLMCILLCDPSLRAQYATFNKSYGGPGDEAGLGMVATPDGGCLVVGSTTSYGPNPSEQYPNGHVIRLDAEGRVIWTRSFGGQTFDYFRDVTMLPNGAYLAVGNYDMGGNASSAQVWLSQIADDGTVIWNKRLGASSRWELGVIVRSLGNGDCIIAGTTTTDPATSDILLMRVDNDGQLVWSTEYRTSERDFPTGMLLLEDGSILLAGIRSVIPRSEGFVMKLDTDGTLLWDRSYAHPDHGLGFTGLVPTANNAYIVASNNGLIKLNDEGHILWSQRYLPTNGDNLGLVDITNLGPARSL